MQLQRTQAKLFAASDTACLHSDAMARRPSAVSVSSIASSSGLPHVSKSPQAQLSPLQNFRKPTSPWPPRSASFSALSQQAHAGDAVDPDELFAKYPVAEVRAVQQRLRSVYSDIAHVPCVLADTVFFSIGQMQMLNRRNCGSWLGAYICLTNRLSAGTSIRKRRERYRDLLQASSSIISIAQSSHRVLDALEDMKASIPSPEEEPQIHRRSTKAGKDGAFRVSLLCSAH